MGAGLAATEPLQSSALTEQEQDVVGGEVEWLVLPLPGLAQSVKGRAEGQSRGSGTPRLAIRRGCHLQKGWGLGRLGHCPGWTLPHTAQQGCSESWGQPRG